MQAATKPSQMTAESVALQQRLVAKCQENAALLETEVEVLAKGSSDNSRKASRTLGCRMEIAQEALKKAKANLAAAQVALATALARQEEEILPKASPSPGVVPFTAEGDSLCDQSQETSKPGDNVSIKYICLACSTDAIGPTPHKLTYWLRVANTLVSGIHKAGLRWYGFA